MGQIAKELYKTSVSPLIPEGVWPTMLTPFTDSNEVDYTSLECMIEWYIKHRVDGLFAVCQSSEMFYLTLEERVEIARFVKEKAKGRIPVIASGHISDSLKEQIEALKKIAETGIDALVLVSNRLATEEETDDVWQQNATRILEEIPDIPFGIYECPYPYKRLMSPELLKWCASTERFLFLKDTCCSLERLQAKVQAVQGSGLKIYNANAATLLGSLKMGIAGYSGVMANFHPDLYVWLLKNWSREPKKAQRLQDFLGLASVIECQYYPVNAKYHMQLSGLDIGLKSRVKSHAGLTAANRLEVEQLFSVTEVYRNMYRL